MAQGSIVLLLTPLAVQTNSVFLIRFTLNYLAVLVILCKNTPVELTTCTLYYKKQGYDSQHVPSVDETSSPLFHIGGAQWLQKWLVHSMLWTTNEQTHLDIHVHVSKYNNEMEGGQPLLNRKWLADSLFLLHSSMNRHKLHLCTFGPISAEEIVYFEWQRRPFIYPIIVHAFHFLEGDWLIYCFTALQHC